MSTRSRVDAAKQNTRAPSPAAASSSSPTTATATSVYVAANDALSASTTMMQTATETAKRSRQLRRRSTSELRASSKQQRSSAARPTRRRLVQRRWSPPSPPPPVYDSLSSSSSSPPSSPQSSPMPMRPPIIVDDYDNARAYSSSSPPHSASTAESFAFAFRNAFLTEIGSLKQRITLDELVDVIICAGVNASNDEIAACWPYDSTAIQITYREGFDIYEKLASRDDAAAVELEAAPLPLNYNHIASKMANRFKIEMTTRERKAATRLLSNWSQRDQTSDDIATTINATRSELRALNTQLIDARTKMQTVKTSSGLLSPHTSNESLSSVISATRNAATAAAATATIDANQQLPSSTIADGIEAIDQPIMSAPSFNMLESGDENLTVKSLIVQTTPTVTRTLIYTFFVPRSAQICVSFRINETIDTALVRFQNTIVGMITSVQTGEIVAITRKREEKLNRTDWTLLPAGSYTFTLRYIRSLRMIEPLDDEPHVDERGNLTKAFKVMLMSIFDLFDLDDDGLLNRDELDTYRLLAEIDGSITDEWASYSQRYTMRADGLTISGFLRLHADEMKALGGGGCGGNVDGLSLEEAKKRRQRHLWSQRLRSLGFNRCLHVSTVAPVFVCVRAGGGERVHMLGHVVHTLDTRTPSSGALFDHYWSIASPLPFMRDIQWLRMLKTDYFAIIIACNVPESLVCQLDLKSSRNVSLDCNAKCTINASLKVGESKILVVAISQSDNWMLNVVSQNGAACGGSEAPNVHGDAASVCSLASYGDISTT